MVKQPLDFALLVRLRLHPVADLLLFGAHVVDEALNAFGQIGQRLCGGAAGGEIGERILQPVQRRFQIRLQVRRNG